MNKITIAELRARLQEALNELEDYEDNDIVCTVSNTYFIKSDYFLSLGRSGFCPLFNIKIESDNDDED